MSNTDRTSSASTSTSSTQAPARTSARPQGGAISRQNPNAIPGGSPFASIFQRWNDDMDRMFGNLGFGGMTRPFAEFGRGAFTPQVEMFQRGHDLVVRADLPGLRREDIHVDVADDVLSIQGERKQEEEEEREGVYRSERSYGSFYREIPLPEGTITDNAKATFKDGVLEVTLQAPPQEVSRGRRLEIQEESGGQSKK